MLVLGCLLILAKLQLVELVRVEVEHGWLEGEQLETVTGDARFYSFKGIPYAAPPLGTLRFKAPQPARPWTEVRNATQHGPVCIQYDFFFSQTIIGSEDCLTLNVYTPELNPPEPLPVMFFIHGGGYETDSGNEDNYGPDFLVQNGVILVTFNYRLGALGFLALDTPEIPGNAGMKDQVAALKWVNRNIRKFGGDPNNITIFGQSAGGASVMYHVISPMSKGLFKRAISMSGVPSCDWSLPYQPRRRALALGRNLGKDTRNINELMEFLQNAPAEKLVNTKPAVLASENITINPIKTFNFIPVIEKEFGQNHFITENPEHAVRIGKFNDVDLMIGKTDDESLIDLSVFEETKLNYYNYPDMIVPLKILRKNTPNEILEISDLIHDYYFGVKPLSKAGLREILDYLKDSSYSYDINRYITLFLQKSRHKIYQYLFTGVSSRNIYAQSVEKYTKGIKTGASHLDDTAYLFDPKRADLKLEKDTKEYKMVKQTSALFTNFAKYGNPTPDNSLGAIWPPYDNTTKNYMDIGETLTVGTALDATAVAFWRSILDKAGIEF